tara:strand:+ start:1355 stop:1555 length:201 start_codon:yes stop_codon:yes gene_type:complete
MKNTANNLIAAIDSHHGHVATLLSYQDAVDALFGDHSDEEILALVHPKMGQIFDQLDVEMIRGELS